MSSAQAEAAPIGFEPRSGETWRDPFPMYKALRDHDPVHMFENDRGEFWALSRRIGETSGLLGLGSGSGNECSAKSEPG